MNPPSPPSFPPSPLTLSWRRMIPPLFPLKTIKHVILGDKKWVVPKLAAWVETWRSTSKASFLAGDSRQKTSKKGTMLFTTFFPNRDKFTVKIIAVHLVWTLFVCSSQSSHSFPNTSILRKMTLLMTAQYSYLRLVRELFCLGWSNYETSK